MIDKNIDLIEFEAVESPEYIAYCEANNQGYKEGISTDGMWIRQKVWMSSDLNNKDFKFFITSTWNPFENERAIYKPYRISSKDGTYKSEAQIRQDFLGSLKWGIAMPKGGTLEDKELPKFTIKYDEDKDV